MCPQDASILTMHTHQDNVNRRETVPKSAGVEPNDTDPGTARKDQCDSSHRSFLLRLSISRTTGCQNAHLLFEEIRLQGFPGSASYVRHYLARWRPEPSKPGRKGKSSALSGSATRDPAPLAPTGLLALGASAAGP